MPVPDGTFFGASPELLVACHGRPGVVPPLGRHRAPGRHRPRRRGRPTRPGPVRQEPCGAPLRGRRDRRDPRARTATSCRSRRALARRLPLGGPPRHEDRGPAAPARRGARAPRASASHAGRRRHAPRRRARASSRRCEAGDRGHWAGPVGWVGAGGEGEWMIGIRSARLHDDARSVTLRAGSGVVAGLGARRRGGRDGRQAGHGPGGGRSRRLSAAAVNESVVSRRPPPRRGWPRAGS